MTNFHRLMLRGNKLHLAAGDEFLCAIGRGGIKVKEREGDGITPIGVWPFRKVYYRPDKIACPITNLPTAALSEKDGWSDDSRKKDYNTHVVLPYSGSHERLWRDDDIYDIIVVIGFNDDPPVAEKGSAIFMHVARQDYSPTEGCIALGKVDLLKVLKTLTPESLVEVIG